MKFPNVLSQLKNIPEKLFNLFREAIATVDRFFKKQKSYLIIFQRRGSKPGVAG